MRVIETRAGGAMKWGGLDRLRPPGAATSPTCCLVTSASRISSFFNCREVHARETHQPELDVSTVGPSMEVTEVLKGQRTYEQRRGRRRQIFQPSIHCVLDRSRPCVWWNSGAELLLHRGPSYSVHSGWLDLCRLACVGCDETLSASGISGRYLISLNPQDHNRAHTGEAIRCFPLNLDWLGVAR